MESRRETGEEGAECERVGRRTREQATEGVQKMIRTEDGTRRGIQGGERRLLEGDQMQANRLRGGGEESERKML